eukprot:353593-Chlamydomonas_euryale.AAC.1
MALTCKPTLACMSVKVFGMLTVVHSAVRATDTIALATPKSFSRSNPVGPLGRYGPKPRMTPVLMTTLLDYKKL